MKERIVSAAKEAQTFVNEADLLPEFRGKAYEVILQHLLGSSPAQSRNQASPMMPGPSVSPIISQTYNTFPEFFMQLECKSNPDIITAMAYFQSVTQQDKRLSVKDIEEYFKLIKPKSANIQRDAKTAVMNAWLKAVEKKDSSIAWELIPIGTQHIEELKKNE